MLAPTYTIKGIWAAIIAGVIALLLAANIAQAVNTYADIRFNLPFGAHLGFEGWKPKAERLAGEIADMKKASDQNAAAQKKANDEQKATFNSSAEKANATYPKALDDNRSVAARYRDTHRVQSGTASVGPSPATAQGDAAGLPETAPAEADYVAVSAADFDASVADYTYAQACYDWAQDLLARGVAEFAPPAPDAPPATGP